MSFHAKAAAVSACSNRLSKFRSYLLSSVCAVLIIIASGPNAHAQQVPGKYFNADGSKTDDLEKAAATWRTPEFVASHALGIMGADYAYAYGARGQGVKIGMMDGEVYGDHPEFNGQNLNNIHVDGKYDINIGALGKKPIHTAGEAFALDGIWYEKDKDIRKPDDPGHGTGTTGTILARRDGNGTHGVAFDSSLYSARSGEMTYEDSQGSLDNNYKEAKEKDPEIFRQSMSALVKAGVRVILAEWQLYPRPKDRGTHTGTLADLNIQYLGGKDGKMLQAMRDAAQAGVLHVVANGNFTSKTPHIGAALPYFEPALEDSWLAVSAGAGDNDALADYSNKCGPSRYFCITISDSMVAPTSTVNSKDRTVEAGFANHNGTSGASAEAAGIMAVMLSRYPYMTASQARTVLLTTARDVGDKGVDSNFGFGFVDLKAAMNGPGQFMGRFDANLGAGVRDTWSNDISQVALDQRKREEAEEVAAWAARKKAQGWESGIGEKQRSELAKIIEPKFSSDKLTTAEGLLANLFKAVAANATTKVNLDVAFANSKIKADPLAKVLLADFTKAYPKAVTTYGTDPSLDYAAYKTNRKDDPLAVLKQSMLAELMMPLETEYQFTETRTAYLSGKLADVKSYDAGLTKSGAGSLWLTGKNSYRGDTVINGGELGIGLGGSIVSASIINDTGLLTVDGTAAAVTANAGGRLKINTTGVTGDLTLNGGFASVDGKSGAAVINAGGVLGGIGLVHSLIARSGGTVSPGNSVGTLHVAGDATFDRGSVFDVEIATDRNRADRLDVGGNVMLLGGVVSVRLAGEKTGLSQAQIKDLFQKSYTILIADGTVSGTFENVLPHYTYITPSLLYAADKSMVSVGFDLTETARTEQAEKLTAAQAAAQAQADRLKAEGLAAEQAQAEADRLKAQLREEQIKNLVLMDAVTPNQKSTGHAVLQLGLGNRLLDTVLLHPQADAALNYDALSGEAHASLRGTLLQDAGLVSGAANERIRAAFDGVAARPVPVIIPLAYGPEDKAKNRQSADQAFDTTTPAPAAPATALWGQGYGAWSHGSSDGNASAYSRNTGGFVTGVDSLIAGTWRLGVLAGYGSTSLHGAGSSTSADSYQLGVYGGTAIDALTLSLGTILAHHAIDTHRSVTFGTLDETESAGYSAKSVQLFGEAAYRIDTAYAAFEPFAAAAYTHLKTDGFSETGGIAALSAPASATDLTTTTLGVRASRAFTLGNATTVTARGMAGWRHAYGDVAPEAQFAFASGGESFAVSGQPIAADTALIEAGLAFDVGKATTIGLTYTGAFSSQVKDNAVKADLTIRF